MILKEELTILTQNASQNRQFFYCFNVLYS